MQSCFWQATSPLKARFLHWWIKFSDTYLKGFWGLKETVHVRCSVMSDSVSHPLTCRALLSCVHSLACVGKEGLLVLKAQGSPGSLCPKHNGFQVALLGHWRGSVTRTLWEHDGVDEETPSVYVHQRYHLCMSQLKNIYHWLNVSLSCRKWL